ncbi:MAG: hypothetical protein J4G05_09130 [Chlorobi bacterium]|nr:hypothetical protein [Chlorobiota bacterium]
MARGDLNNWTSALIEAVDQEEQGIVLRVKVDLLNLQSQDPRPALHQLILKMVMELPY